MTPVHAIPALYPYILFTYRYLSCGTSLGPIRSRKKRTCTDPDSGHNESCCVMTDLYLFRAAQCALVPARSVSNVQIAIHIGQ